MLSVLLLFLLLIHMVVQSTATKQGDILKMQDFHSARLSAREQHVPEWILVNVPQMKVFVLQVGFVGVKLAEVRAAAHSSLLINAAALFHLASVSDTYVHTAPITHSFISSFPAVPCQSLAARCLLK